MAQSKTTFADLFSVQDESFYKPGSLIKSTILTIDNDYIVVDAGLKAEVHIPTREFRGADNEVTVAVGDEIDVVLETGDDSFGEPVLSFEKAKRAEAWKKLTQYHENAEVVTGRITGKVKGGFTVDVEGIRAFLPGSLIDVRPIRDTSHLEEKELEFKVIKLDSKRNNVVVSRRAVLSDANSVERDKLLEGLAEGQEVKGVVKNLTDYGAFVDLGGIDGLLHITDMSWKRIKHPEEIVKVGDEILVRIMKFDKDRSRVSLGLKQMGEDPWENIASRHPVGSKLTGKISNIADYGCFVEIENGVEGLVHISEMDWTNKNVNPNKLVQMGEAIEVMVLEIDEERRRISLGIKQCQNNPWQHFSDTHGKGDKVKGAIKSITDFGIFIGLDGNIDGLIHLSDLSWSEAGEEAVKQYKKGEEVEAVVLAIDPERERISLGIKQLESDDFSEYAEAHPKGALVSGKVTAVEEKEVAIELAPEITGVLKASEVSSDKSTDLREIFKEAEDVEAKVMAFDRKTRTVSLSIKAKDTQPGTAASGGEEQSKSTLGDLLKAQLSGNSDASSD